MIILWQMQVLNLDSGDGSLPEDDPDSVVVEFVDFIKVQPLFFAADKDLFFFFLLQLEKPLLIVIVGNGSAFTITLHN